MGIFFLLSKILAIWEIVVKRNIHYIAILGMFFLVVYIVYDYEEWLISLTAKSCYTVWLTRLSVA